MNCTWPANDALMIAYHDHEWGKPLHDDRQLFEFLILEGFQAGLSWKTVLHKRENFRVAFDNFDPEVIVTYDEYKIQSLMNDSGIIRNQAKIRGTIINAQLYLDIQKEFGSFDSYIWQFTDGKTLVNHFISVNELPSKTPISDAMSKALLKKGFKFVGSTICYAFMQATGMVNDHIVSCRCR